MQLIATRTLTHLPGAPALSATVTGATTATLNWSGPVPTGISVLAGYRLKRASVISGPYTTLYTGLNLSVNDTVASGTVFYTIEAFDQFGTGTVSAPVSVAYAGGGGTFTMLMEDDFSEGTSGPVNQNKFNGLTGTTKWVTSDNFDTNLDPFISYSTLHSRFGGLPCARGQLTFTKTLVGGLYTQWANEGPNVDGNSAHRQELNITGLPTYAPTGWVSPRSIFMKNEYWYGWSVWIPPAAPDANGDAFPVASWPGYLILFQLHDINVAGANPMFTLTVDAPIGQNAQVLGTALRTNWILTSLSRTDAGPHTFKRYDLGPIAGDRNQWTDWVARYIPDFNQYTGPEPPTNCKGIVQLWKNGVLQALLTAQGQINWPNAGEPHPSGGLPNQAPYCVPFFYYTAWAQTPDASNPNPNPSFNNPPPADYPHQSVYYAAEFKHGQAFGNPQAAVDSSNFAYQAVKPRGNRLAGT